MGVTLGLVVVLVVGGVVALQVPDDPAAAPAPGSTATPVPSGSATGPSPLPPASPTPTVASVERAVLRTPTGAATVLPAGTDAAVRVSATVFGTSPVVVVAQDDEAALLTGATVAVGLGAPLLPVDAADEMARLGARTVVTVGDVETAGLPDEVRVVAVAAGAGPEALHRATGVIFGAREEVAEGDEADAVRALGARPVPCLVPSGGVAADGPASTTSPPADPTTDPTTDPTADSTTTDPATDPTTDPTAEAPPSPLAAQPALVPGLVGVVGDEEPSPTALATMRAAGMPVLDAPGDDPRTTTGSVRAFAQAEPQHVVALGSGLGPADRLAQRVATAATGVVAPGGGQLVFPDVPGVPGKRYVALYGTPGTASLGLLGEQGVTASVDRARQYARNYASRTGDTVVPAVEIIATVASASAGEDRDYSRERPVAELRPLVEAAGEAGLSVVLDLQPGRTDFLTQAQQYTELLELPHVGLALDPEWRLEQDEVHLEQIGSVDVDEVNEVGDWLADLTATHHLPQKMFVLHQFSLKMITDRDRLDTSHDELATVIHVDGQGTQPAKRDTWRALRAGAPDVHWGWKNFVDEDRPMLTVEQTMRLEPVPDLVTYQ
ncbi:hypothetical protein KIN34_10530 [Cellulomonas sp. DKR-3]|uniref:Lipoprotein n=1 Tax=Cellulomonas fulva TaxID=2835530 RepID=A0ABS5TZY2_9CELL|nr:hypothetical protein [Cellulomonas fulva]